MLDVVKYDGVKITGKLRSFQAGSIVLETEVNFRDSKTGKRKSELKLQEIKQEEIKTAKVNISLKSK
jgi:hypothetical protein